MAETDKKVIQRRNILAEIESTEAGYLQDLEILVNTYKIPLQKTGFVTQDTVNKIFLNIESLLGIHTRMKLELATKPFVTVIASFAPQLKVYSVFTEGCDDGVALWLDKANNDKRLKNWEAEISASEGPCKGLFLKDFLIKPVQRICKYPLLLRELLACVEGEELEAAQEAQTKVNTLLSDINSMKDAHVSFQQLSALTNRLYDYNGSLVKRERHFLRETKLTMKEGKLASHMNWTPQNSDPVVLLLFSDILLITTPRKDKLKLVKELQAKDIFIVDARDHPNVDVAFFIEYESLREQGNTSLFFTEKPAEKKVLFSLLRKTANKAKEQAFKAKPVAEGEQDPASQAPQMVIVQTLCNAAMNGDLDKINTMLEHGGIKTFINTLNSKGQTALHCAAQKGHKSVVNALLTSEHIDIHAVCNGETALHAAVTGNHLDVVVALILKGASVETKNKAGLTPKQLAINNKLDQVAECFQVASEKGLVGLRAKYLSGVGIPPSSSADLLKERKSYGRKNSFAKKRTVDPIGEEDTNFSARKSGKIVLSGSTSDASPPPRPENTKLIEARAENMKLLEENSRLFQENAALKEREEANKKSEGDKDALSKKTKNQAMKLKKTQEELEKLQGEHAKMFEEKNNLIVALNNNLTQLDQENEKLATLIQKLTVTLQNVQNENNHLLQENNAQREKVDLLDEENAQLAGLVQKYVAFKDTNEALSQVNAMQKKKIADLATTIAALTE